MIKSNFFTRFLKLNPTERSIIIKISFWSIWTFLMIQLLSFKTYSNWQNSKKTGKHIDIVILQKAVKKIERHAFWPNTCFSIALAVKIYLNQQQVASQIVFGLKKEAEGELKAHAWLKIDDNIISGNYRIDEYTEMYRFE